MSKTAKMPQNEPFLKDGAEIEGESLSLRWMPVERIPDLLWEKNPKLHDIGTLWESILANGFVDPAKWDVNLKNKAGGQGALVYGNGRSEAVWWGWQQYKQGLWIGDIPRGIGKDKEGNWYIQIKFGLDAVSEAAAADFAISHNNLTMLGGDFEDGDVWRMYDKNMLLEVGLLIQDDDDFQPLSMTEEEIEALSAFLNPEDDTFYTRKIETPLYEPQGDKPKLETLYDDSKTKQLIAEIEAAQDLNKDEKAFLKIAAQRHTVLDFTKIANFYAHSNAEVQRLMEDSALVIIDYNRAIELGFVKLTNRITELETDDNE